MWLVVKLSRRTPNKLFVLIILLLSVQSTLSFRRKVIKQHTRNVTDFNFSHFFPSSWVDSIREMCSDLFHREVFQCHHNVFLNVLTPTKNDSLVGTPEGSFIFAYATFAFVYQMKKVCLEKDFQLNCGCASCLEHYPKKVCERLKNRTYEDSFGGCDPKSRFAMKVLEHFTTGYLMELNEVDQEKALLVASHMEVGTHEAVKFVRGLAQTVSGEKCECAAFYCPEQTPLTCYKNYLNSQKTIVAHNLFDMYKNSIRSKLNNESVWVSMDDMVLRADRKLLYMKEYEPDCEREVKGRECTPTNELRLVSSSQSSKQNNELIDCGKLCNYCINNSNYTIMTEIQRQASCNCTLVPETLDVKCFLCDVAVHKCEPLKLGYM